MNVMRLGQLARATATRFVLYKAIARPTRRPSALALGGLMGLSVLLLSPLPAARAGHYEMTSQTGGQGVNGDGTSTDYSQNGDAPGYYGGLCYDLADMTPPWTGAACSGKITTVFDWVPDPRQTLQTDPPPQYVLVMQACDAGWATEIPGGAGSCGDGLGDPEVDQYGYDEVADGYEATSGDSGGIENAVTIPRRRTTRSKRVAPR